MELAFVHYIVIRYIMIHEAINKEDILPDWGPYIFIDHLHLNYADTVL